MLDSKQLDTYSPHVRTSYSILDTMFRRYSQHNFAVRLWDGTLWQQGQEQPQFTLILKHPGALRSMFLPPNDLSIGEAYIYGDFDIEGDMQAALRLGHDIMFFKKWGFRDYVQIAWKLLQLPTEQHPLKNGRAAAELSGKRYSVSRNKQAIRYHYDVSNEFYQLWLDKRMVYSCAYFESTDDSLDTAQERKLDYLCRKLRLQRGDKLLDIGCGWGGLVIYAAQNYGVQAHGITLSQAQADLANERIHAAGLEDQVTVEILDYRELTPAEQYDKIISVGMVEHVGRNVLPEYFQCAYDLLRPGGVFLNHGIGCDELIRFEEAGFVQKYIFPDGDAVPLYFMLQTAEKVGFDVRDVENLREHYALTIAHWYRRLRQQREAALKMLDIIMYRTWEIYLATARSLFESTGRHLYQTLLYKRDGGKTQLPLTRGDWYA